MDEVSRRDLFAMAALQGLLAGPSMIKSEELSKYAYKIADDMIKQGAEPKLAEVIDTVNTESENAPA